MSRFAVRRPHRPARARGAVGLVAVLAGVLVGIVVGPTAPAAAHDELIATEPAPEAVLDTAPEVLALDFSADLLNISPTIVLTGPAGAVDLDEPVVTGTRVAAGVPQDLPSGGYTVAWRVVSGDGHPIQGSFAFTVRGPAATQEPAPAPSTTDPPTTPTAEAGSATNPASPSPTATQQPGDLAGGTPDSTPLAIAAVALAAIGGVVAVLVRRRRRPTL